MKQLKYVLIFVILVFIPNIAKAEECSVTNTSRLKKIASNITTKYDYVENLPTTGYGNVDFTATISNVISDIYIMKVDDYYNKIGTVYYGDGNNQVIISGLSAGKSYHFVAFGNTGEGCTGTLVYEFYVTTPSYNKYYINTLCKKVPDYKYCQKWVNFNLTEEEFTKNVKQYIKSLEVEETPPEEEKPEDQYQLFIKIMEFLTKYDIPIFGSIVILSTIGIVIYRKKDNFDLSVK
jgi:hypothetical protein